MARAFFIGIIILTSIGGLCTLLGSIGVFLAVLEAIKQERQTREQKAREDREYEGMKQSLLRTFEKVI